MTDITKCKIIGYVNLFGSLLMNPQLTIAIVASIIVFFTIGICFNNSIDDFDIEEQQIMANMLGDEFREKVAFLFMIGAMLITLIVSIYNIIILF